MSSEIWIITCKDAYMSILGGSKFFPKFSFELSVTFHVVLGTVGHVQTCNYLQGGFCSLQANS